MTDARIVFTTLADIEQANLLARKLVELHLAACVNLIERVHSIYRWKGEVEAADEVLLVIKTTVDTIPMLKEKMGQLHPYELPELVVLEVTDGSGPYLDWLLAGCHDEAK